MRHPADKSTLVARDVHGELRRYGDRDGAAVHCTFATTVLVAMIDDLRGDAATRFDWLGALLKVALPALRERLLPIGVVALYTVWPFYRLSPAAAAEMRGRSVSPPQKDFDWNRQHESYRLVTGSL